MRIDLHGSCKTQARRHTETSENVLAKFPTNTGPLSRYLAGRRAWALDVERSDV